MYIPPHSPALSAAEPAHPPCLETSARRNHTRKRAKGKRAKAKNRNYIYIYIYIYMPRWTGGGPSARPNDDKDNNTIPTTAAATTTTAGTFSLPAWPALIWRDMRQVESIPHTLLHKQ